MLKIFTPKKWGESAPLIRKPKIPQPSENLIFYDYETVLNENNRHKVQICCAITFKGKKKVFYSVKDFGDWLFYDYKPEDGNSKTVTIIAHNGKAFDHHYTLGYILENLKYTSESFRMIETGSKLMYFSVKHGKLTYRFIDSVNFTMMPLEKFPESFGFEDLNKGYFPYLFKNTKYVGPLKNIPIDDFCFKKIKNPKKYKTAIDWYEKNKDTIFNYQEKLLEYCMNDVEILRKGCLKLRKDLLNLNSLIDKINEERKLSYEKILPHFTS